MKVDATSISSREKSSPFLGNQGFDHRASVRRPSTPFIAKHLVNATSSAIIRDMKIRVAAWLAMVAASATVAAQTASEPATLDCAALATESSSLKAGLKGMNGSAGQRAQLQANTQQATAVTAMAGQVAASVVGIVGHVITEAAIEAQRIQVAGALSNARTRIAETTALSRRVQALEAERARRCPQGVVK